MIYISLHYNKVNITGIYLRSRIIFVVSLSGSLSLSNVSRPNPNFKFFDYYKLDVANAVPDNNDLSHHLLIRKSGAVNVKV